MRLILYAALRDEPAWGDYDLGYMEPLAADHVDTSLPVGVKARRCGSGFAGIRWILTDREVETCSWLSHSDSRVVQGEGPAARPGPSSLCARHAPCLE